MEASSKNFHELAELHAHIAPSIPPSVYWHLAQSEGYKLPKRDYHEFVEYLLLSSDRKMTLREYLDEIYHPILDKLSSGAGALETAVYESLSGAYRSHITLLELRGNPMKHNHEGEVDLDHAIMAMLRGMEKALLEYPKLRSGLIFCLDRQFSFEKNKIIVEKAIKYHRRGVVGIDFSNYVFENYNPAQFYIKDYTELVEEARAAGLKVTIHTAEANDANNDITNCIKYINPDRIGHGIKAAYDKKLLKEIARKGIVLEVCPFSNLMTKAVKDIQELTFILHTFLENDVKFCINTDWPEMLKDAHLNTQLEFLLQNKILTEKQIEQTINWAFEASFIPRTTSSNLYL